MKLLLVGEYDFLGEHIAARLREWGHEVIVDGRKTRSSDDKTTFADSAPDTVVVLPGFTMDQVLQTVEAFNPIARRIVYCSRLEAYRAFARHTREEPGPPDLVPLLEDDPLRETGNLAAIEKAILAESKLPVTILRLPQIFGPGGTTHLLSEYLSAMDAGASEIFITPAFAQWRRATGYVEDIGLGIALAAKNSKAVGRTYNIADSFAFAQKDWIQAIGRAAEWDGDVVISSEVDDNGRDFEQHLIVDSSRIRQELGYAERVPINEAFERTVRWEREAAAD